MKNHATQLTGWVNAWMGPRPLVSGVQPCAAPIPASGVAVDYELSRRMLCLAVGSLLVAGCFSLFLIVGRLPQVSGWFGDPLFFKRCLVLHVDLALIVWFFSFAAALFGLLPADRWSHALFRLGFLTACAGVGGMVLGTLWPGTAPVLANYVPVIDNPLYVGGIAVFFVGLLLCFLNERLFVQVPGVSSLAPASLWDPWRITPDVALALKTSALAYLLAMSTFAVSWAATPAGLPPAVHYEVVFWGGGHVLQVANVAAMLAVWLLLVSSLIQAPVLSPGAARVLFAALLAPHLVAPLLTADGTVGALYRLGFTRLMQFGIAPVVLVILGVCVMRLWRARRCGQLGDCPWWDARFAGFAASVALTLTGFALGASIRAVNTMIPAHYHASIGAVTVVFMAITYRLLGPLGFEVPGGRWQAWMPWQLYLFGGGQVIFAAGFALGGAHGLSRKAYGADQYFRSIGEWAGLLVMSTGGLVAVVGGLMFLALMMRAVRGRRAVHAVCGPGS